MLNPPRSHTPVSLMPVLTDQELRGRSGRASSFLGMMEIVAFV